MSTAYTQEGITELLNAWWYWHEYKLLPYSGGYYDQPHDLMQDFRTLDRVYAYHIKRRDLESE